ncbi:hypothetical protein B0H13DRAFT_2303397 [Mycena leptocephala]|nr:hypothetical protein B0H13DRAFT_2303397 [Mycena leptocephala]
MAFFLVCDEAIFFVRDGASFLMAMSPLAIMHDGILFPMCDSTFSSSSSPSSAKAYWSHSVRDSASFLCVTAPSIGAPRRVFPRVHQRPPFMGNGAVPFRVREAPLIQSVRDSASFSCPTGPSVRHCASFLMWNILPVCTAFFLHARQRLLLVSTGPSLSAPLRPFLMWNILPVCDGILPSRATAPPSRVHGAFTQCAIAPLSSCAILPCVTAFFLHARRRLLSCPTGPSLSGHCASPPCVPAPSLIAAIALLSSVTVPLFVRVLPACDDALFSCSTEVFLSARQHPPSSVLLPMRDDPFLLRVRQRTFSSLSSKVALLVPSFVCDGTLFFVLNGTSFLVRERWTLSVARHLLLVRGAVFPSLTQRTMLPLPVRNVALSIVRDGAYLLIRAHWHLIFVRNGAGSGALHYFAFDSALLRLMLFMHLVCTCGLSHLRLSSFYMRNAALLSTSLFTLLYSGAAAP